MIATKVGLVVIVMKTPEIKMPVVVPLGLEEWRLGLEVIWRRPACQLIAALVYVCMRRMQKEALARLLMIGCSGYFIFTQVSK